MNGISYIDKTAIREDLDGKCVIVVDVDRDIEIARKNKIFNIELNRVFNNDSISDLSFLQGCDFIEGITIISNRVFDLTGLMQLEKLGNIFLDCDTNTKIDFTIFRNLKFFGTSSYNKNYDTVLSSRTIEELVFWKYKEEDFMSFEQMTNLTGITLTKSKIKSTKGIEKIKHLKKLRLNGNRQMEFLEFEDDSMLEFISIYGFSQLKGFLGFSHLHNLRILHVQNCPRIASIASLNDCPKLEALALFDGTKIADGDLAILKRLKKTWLQDFKHYNVKRKDLTSLTSELAYL